MYQIKIKCHIEVNSNFNWVFFNSSCRAFRTFWCSLWHEIPALPCHHHHRWHLYQRRRCRQSWLQHMRRQRRRFWRPGCGFGRFRDESWHHLRRMDLKRKVQILMKSAHNKTASEPIVALCPWSVERCMWRFHVVCGCTTEGDLNFEATRVATPSPPFVVNLTGRRLHWRFGGEMFCAFLCHLNSFVRSATYIYIPWQSQKHVEFTPWSVRLPTSVRVSFSP